MSARFIAPLWAAAHLPLKGGDWLSLTVSPVADVAGWRNSNGQRISPLVGELSGRTEGGAVEHQHCRKIALAHTRRYSPTRPATASRPSAAPPPSAPAPASPVHQAAGRSCGRPRSPLHRTTHAAPTSPA